MTKPTFEEWKAKAIAYAQNIMQEEDVYYLIGDDEEMREFGFDFESDPEEYVDDCIADAAASV